ncbi:MAG TPA: TMEM165/GDT1 family protein [Acidimicrobiales bacterium]|nr:TMEM165/GDT1 family protein [Acidimicrobiales bacterium]
MNFGALVATFAIVIPAELPDKTMITCIVMSSRHRSMPVWIGGAAALILQAGIAVVAGRLLALLPATPLHAVVAALFVAGAAYLICVPEKQETSTSEALVEAEEEREEAKEEAAGVAASPWRPALTTFSIVALAEFGDVTQIVIANLTAHYHAPLEVFLGASAAFVLVSGIGVLGGRTIIRVVPLSIVRRISGVILLGLGIYTIVGLL